MDSQHRIRRALSGEFSLLADDQGGSPRSHRPLLEQVLHHWNGVGPFTGAGSLSLTPCRTSLFVEAYTIFSIGNLTSLFAAVWPTCWSAFLVLLPGQFMFDIRLLIRHLQDLQPDMGRSCHR